MAKPDLEFHSSRELLNSILQNLIYNAIKYRKPIAESFLNILIQKIKRKIIFEISDNGIGISKELQPCIFEMFFRATISSSGTGLGLYIVKNAVEKLSGEISFKSVPGKGLTFKVVLPVQKN